MPASTPAVKKPMPLSPDAKPNPPFATDGKFSIVKGPFIVRFD